MSRFMSLVLLELAVRLKVPNTQQSVRSWLRLRIRNATAVVTTGIVFATAVASVARWHWIADLTTHFRVQYLLVSLMAGVVLTLCRSYRWAAVAALACLWNVQVIRPYLTGVVTAPGLNSSIQQSGGVQSIRILFSNVFVGNPDPTRLLRLIESSDPDVIVLMEVTSQWLQTLSRLNDQYPHSAKDPRSDSFGIAAWSRTEVETFRTRLNNPASVPEIETRLIVGQQSVALLGIHTLPPVSSSYSSTRNMHLQELAERCASFDDPVIIVGDLNITPWSPLFSDLLESAGLHDSRSGRGILPSWPVGRLPLRIPIDHCLTTTGLRVEAMRIGPDIGSDHFPVIVDVGVQ